MLAHLKKVVFYCRFFFATCKERLTLRAHYITFQMYSYACKVMVFAFVALYTANFFGKSLQQTMEVSLEREAATGFDPFTGKYDQTCLSRNS